MATNNSLEKTVVEARIILGGPWWWRRKRRRPDDLPVANAFGGSILPFTAVPQDLFDDIFIPDKGNGLHLAGAFRALERINLIKTFDKCSPGNTITTL